MTLGEFLEKWAGLSVPAEKPGRGAFSEALREIERDHRGLVPAWPGRPAAEIRAMIARIEGDARYGYPSARVDVNAPLALIQVEMKAQARALRFALGEGFIGTSAAEVDPDAARGRVEAEGSAFDRLPPAEKRERAARALERKRARRGKG